MYMSGGILGCIIEGQIGVCSRILGFRVWSVGSGVHRLRLGEFVLISTPPSYPPLNESYLGLMKFK